MATNGHKFKKMVDDEPREVRIDRRLAERHKNMRTNLRNDRGERPFLKAGEFMKGTAYGDLRTCVKCSNELPLRFFVNMAVDSEARGLNGLNICCRACQGSKYVKGYKKESEAFITSDGESENGELSSDDEEEEEDQSHKEDNYSSSDEEEEEETSKKRRYTEEDSSDSSSSDEEEDDDIYVVKRIRDERQTNGKVQVLIEWEDYPDKKDWTWEPKTNLLGSYFKK